MKQIIAKYLPYWVINLYRKSGLRKSRFENKTTQEVFYEIYNSNFWASEESISGTGSELKQTQEVIKALEQIIQDFNIKSILDIPCGDFNWMQYVNLNGVNYTGADIVKALVDRNQQKFSKENINFISLNLLSDSLPKNDLVLNRDCLVHLSNADVLAAIHTVKNSDCTYFLSTTNPMIEVNQNIVTGDWRPLNLEKAPFNLPKPLLVIKEHCTEKNMQKDKAIALWKIEDLR